MKGAIGTYTNGTMLYKANCKICTNCVKSKRGYYCKTLNRYSGKLRRCHCFVAKPRESDAPVRVGKLKEDGSIMWEGEA